MYRLAFSLLVAGLFIAAQPVLAKDYVIKLELTESRTETVVSKLGGGRPKESAELRTVEILVTPGQPFRTKITRHNDELLIQGILVEDTDGKVALEIDCRKIEKTPSGVNNTTRCTNNLGLELDKSIQLGGMETKTENQTPFTSRRVQSKASFLLTASEDRGP
jgi:hypothetical protein